MILLTGSPRSGTTWVLELLETIPRTRRVWEPFFTGVGLDARQLAGVNFGLGLRPYLPVEENHSELESYFERLLIGKEYDPLRMRGIYTFTHWELVKRNVASNKTIIKFCRAQRLLPWLLQRFSVRSILLIRHPLAVVASQLHHPGFQLDETSNVHPVISNQVAVEWPELSLYTQTLTHLEEKLAASWCFDYLIPLRNWNFCEKALLLIYENLVTEPGHELTRIERHLGIKFPLEVFHQLANPSATTVEDSNVLTGKDRLSTWENRLSSEQVDRILSVIRVFGLDFYTQDLKPNFERLREFMNLDVGTELRGDVTTDRNETQDAKL